MIAADWGYAIPGAMVVAGGLWFVTEVVVDGARTLWMDRQVRRTQIVEGAGAGDRPRTAAVPSTSAPYDWEQADFDEQLAAIARSESQRIHPSTGGQG